MADLPPLATVEQVGEVLRADLPTDDPTAAFWLDVVSDVVREYTGQKINRVVDDVEYYDPPVAGYLQLRQLPVETVTKVETLDRSTGLWSERVLTTDWYPVESLGQVGLSTYWTWYSAGGSTPQSWRVTYTHGYTDVPKRLRGAVAKAAARLMNTPVGVASERVGARSTQYTPADVFDPFELMIIQGFRDLRLA